MNKIPLGSDKGLPCMHTSEGREGYAGQLQQIVAHQNHIYLEQDMELDHI